MAEVLGQRERSGVPTGGDALEIGLLDSSTLLDTAVIRLFTFQPVVSPVNFFHLFICMVDVTIFGFNLSFVQLQVVPCFSSGPTGKVWGPTSRSKLPCYDSQPTVLYCHCDCQGTGARYALTTAPGSFRCLGVNIQYTRPPDWYRAWSKLPCRDAAMILNSCCVIVIDKPI